MRLILASASPRRRELLSRAGLEFEVRPSSTEEVIRPGELPAKYTAVLSRPRIRKLAIMLDQNCTVAI
ncbi:MAG: Maf family protein [Acidobacteriia bacterium]|nr:Maf family protein [Terriglobia bacterium]